MTFVDNSESARNPDFYNRVEKSKLTPFIKMVNYLVDKYSSQRKAYALIGISKSFHHKLNVDGLLSISNGKKILAAYKKEKLKEKSN